MFGIAKRTSMQKKKKSTRRDITILFFFLSSVREIKLRIDFELSCQLFDIRHLSNQFELSYIVATAYTVVPCGVRMLNFYHPQP